MTQVTASCQWREETKVRKGDFLVLVGVATSSKRKFQGFKRLVGGGEIGCEQVVMPYGLEEPDLANPVEMGLGKLDAWQPIINQAMLSVDLPPDYVVVADVLGVGPFNQVLKKPDQSFGSSLEIFTEQFSKWYEWLIQQGEWSLSLNYSLLQTIAQVDTRTRRIAPDSAWVRWDRVRLGLSLPLVKWLLDPDNLSELVSGDGKIFTKNSILGIRWEELIPGILAVASKMPNDNLSIMCRLDSLGRQGVYLDAPGDWERHQSYLSQLIEALTTNMTRPLAQTLIKSMTKF